MTLHIDNTPRDDLLAKIRDAKSDIAAWNYAYQFCAYYPRNTRLEMATELLTDAGRGPACDGLPDFPTGEIG